MYTGLGYDVHRFQKGRPLILGGLKIKHSSGLKGHSDADVLVHALMDALLGAAGLRDIGFHFPNTDPKYEGISSITLLKQVISMLKKKKLRINNADITVIAEKPPLSPYINKIKSLLADVLKIKRDRIGLKATTNEKMGFIGRGEGIASIAVVTLRSSHES